MAGTARRVVVTGVGIVSPLGVGTELVWSRLLEGRSGISRLTAGTPGIDMTEDQIQAMPVRIAGVVPRGTGEGLYDPHKVFGRDMSRELSKFIQFAMCASDEALLNAKFSRESLLQGTNERFGVAIASGIGALEETIAACEILRTSSVRKLSPHYVPKILVNLAAGYVSIRNNLRGPNHAVSTACAAGAHAIGDAFNFIQMGYADVMLAGGTESSINPLAIGGFSRLRALATPEDATDATTVSRPFDESRSGFVLGEGATVLVLEELQHALARNAPIIGEVGGYGLSGDAFHITAPSEDGRGAIGAMTQAIQRSGLAPEDVDYVNAHATSTPVGDQLEAGAIDRVFCNRQSLLVSSCKGATGHLLGAAGALEAAFALLAVRDDVVPHTLNLQKPSPVSHFTHVIGQPVQRKVSVALSNSFGFGGTNASLLVKKYLP